MTDGKLTSKTPQRIEPSIRVADLHTKRDAESIVRLLDEYAADPMGRGRRLEADAKSRLVDDLSRHPSVIVYLAEVRGECLGVAVCFRQYSTFGAFDLMNIHDFAITGSARGTGMGRAMLRGVCNDAQQRGCKKVTLEVRQDNVIAQNLYRTEAFSNCEPPMLFWQREL